MEISEKKNNFNNVTSTIKIDIPSQTHTFIFIKQKINSLTQNTKDRRKKTLNEKENSLA